MCINKQSSEKKKTKNIYKYISCWWRECRRKKENFVVKAAQTNTRDPSSDRWRHRSSAAWVPRECSENKWRFIYVMMKKERGKHSSSRAWASSASLLNKSQRLIQVIWRVFWMIWITHWKKRSGVNWQTIKIRRRCLRFVHGVVLTFRYWWRANLLMTSAIDRRNLWTSSSMFSSPCSSMWPPYVDSLRWSIVAFHNDIRAFPLGGVDGLGGVGSADASSPLYSVQSRIALYSARALRCAHAACLLTRSTL